MLSFTTKLCSYFSRLPISIAARLPRSRLLLLQSARGRSTRSAVFHNELFTRIKPEEIAPRQKHRLAGAAGLPGSNSDTYPKFLAGPRQDIPHALKAEHADQFTVTQWAQHCRKVIEEKLPKYGAVLFRGLPMSDGNHFLEFSNSLGFTPKNYEGGSSNRPAFDEKRIISISNEPKEMFIDPHNELAYYPVYPTKVILFCVRAPGEDCGGLTPVVRNSDVLEKLDTNVVQKFEEKQIRYIRNCPSQEQVGEVFEHFSWQSTFNTDDPKVAEELLKEGGLSYQWKSDGSLTYWYNMPAFITHPETGQKEWFNQIDLSHFSFISGTRPEFDPNKDLLYHHCCYGDGTEIEPAVIQHIREVKWSCAVGFQWKDGDLLVIDNLTCMHARESYKGERKMLAFLATD